MYTITTRPPTAGEGDQIIRETQQMLPSLGCLAFIMVAGALGFGGIGGCAAGLVSEDAGDIGRWIGWGIGAFLCVALFAYAIPHMRRMHKKAAKAREAWVVEEISVKDSRVVEIFGVNDNVPVLAFQIGDEKILLLQGQWLEDAATYDAPELTEDPPEEFINGLPAPHSFPSDAFTITRLPESGAVLRIRVTGAYLRPEKAITVPVLDHEFGDSELFECHLDDLSGMLAHRARAT